MIPGKPPLNSSSLYRELPATKRVAILTALITQHKDARAQYIQRMVARGGGFRAAALMQWPPAKLAGEVVRMNAQTADDEIDLLKALYVDIKPAIQEAFLKAAGVKADGAQIDASLQPPFADAAAVQRAGAAVLSTFADEGLHYLRTIARHNGTAWPGIESHLPERTPSG